jgi:CBS domain-containing protein
MQPDTTRIALPALENVIETHPLTTTPDTPIVDVIALISQGQKTRALSIPG